MKKNIKLRLLLSFLGVILIGVAVSFLRIADLGTDPFTTFNLGFSAFLGIPFGTFILISNILALVLVFFSARRFIGFGTLFNILLVGYTSDFIVYLFQSQFGEIRSLLLRGLASLAGIILLAAGAALYIAADLGVAPYDALPIIIEEKSKGRLHFRSVRIVIDVLCTLTGFAFGATVGVSTVITAFFMGPLIHFFRAHFQLLIEQSEKKTDLASK